MWISFFQQKEMSFNTFMKISTLIDPQFLHVAKEVLNIWVQDHGGLADWRASCGCTSSGRISDSCMLQVGFLVLLCELQVDPVHIHQGNHYGIILFFTVKSVLQVNNSRLFLKKKTEQKIFPLSWWFCLLRFPEIYYMYMFNPRVKPLFPMCESTSMIDFIIILFVSSIFCLWCHDSRNLINVPKRGSYWASATSIE